MLLLLLASAQSETGDRHHKISINKSSFTNIVNLMSCPYQNNHNASRYTGNCNRILFNSWTRLTSNRQTRGGAVQVNSLTTNLTMEWNIFVLCKAGSGGACALSCRFVNFSYNAMDLCNTTDPRNEDNFGSVFVYSSNHPNLIYFYAYKNNYTNGWFYKGGGLATSCTNLQLYVYGDLYTQCNATEFGGGMHINNYRGTNELVETYFNSCGANLGGAIGFDCSIHNTNSSLKVAGCRIDECVANRGMAIHNFNNPGVSLSVIITATTDFRTAVVNCNKNGREVFSLTANYVEINYLSVFDSVGNIINLNPLRSSYKIPRLVLNFCNFRRCRPRRNNDGIVIVGRIGNLIVTECNFEDIIHLLLLPIIDTIAFRNSVFNRVDDVSKSTIGTQNARFTLTYESCRFVNSSITVRTTTTTGTEFSFTKFMYCSFEHNRRPLDVISPTNIEVNSCNYNASRGHFSMFKFSDISRSLIIRNCVLTISDSNHTLFTVGSLARTAYSEINNCTFTINGGYALVVNGSTTVTMMNITSCQFNGNGQNPFIKLSGIINLEGSSFMRLSSATAPVVHFLGGRLSLSRTRRNCFNTGFSNSFLVANQGLYDNIVDSNNNKILDWSSNNNFCFQTFLFTLTSQFSTSSSFTRSNTFSSSAKFSKSGNFMPSNQFTNSIKMTKSGLYSNTLRFTESMRLTKSSQFAQSNAFTGSNHFTRSSKFSRSNIYSQSSLFTNSDKHRASMSYTPSNSMTQSNIFSFTSLMTFSASFSISKHLSKSNIFTESNQLSQTETLTKSNKFSMSNKFTGSNFFTRSSNMNETVQFTQSIQMTKSGQFKNTQNFTASSLKSESALFTRSMKMSESAIFSRTTHMKGTNVFSISNNFSISLHMSKSIQFSRSNNFSMSISFSQSDLLTPSDHWGQSHHFTPSSKFTPSNKFSPSLQMSKSSRFSETNSMSRSDSFSLSSSFDKSDRFSISKQFSSSAHMSRSKMMSSSKKYSLSDVYTKSAIFSVSKTYSISDKMSQSIQFSSTSKFTPSSIFTPSNIFTPSDYYDQSHKFTPSRTFTGSSKYTMSEKFTKSGKMTKSSSFTKTNHFTKSVLRSYLFTASNKMSKSDFFSETASFSKTIIFSRTKTMTESRHFTSSKQHDQTKKFTASSKFTASHYFIRTSTFTLSSQFDQTNEFSDSNVLTPSLTITFHIEVDQVGPGAIDVNMNKKSYNTGIIAGIIIGIILIALLITAMLLYFSRKKDDDIEDDPYDIETNEGAFSSSNQMSTMENPLYDGDIDQDQDPFEFDFIEGDTVFQGGINL